MTSLMWWLLVVQVLVPLALLAWILWARPRSRTTRVLGVGATAMYLLAVALAGMWLAPPWYTPFIYGLLFLGALGFSRARGHPSALSPRRIRNWLATAWWGTAAVAFGGAALYAFMGRAAPQDAIELEFPLDHGTYYVASGGANGLLNAHFLTVDDPRYRAFRGQSFGVDFMKLDGWGLRSRGVAPSDPEAYLIWGQPVYAPCAGTVVEAVDGRPDMRPPAVDREYLPGNNVLLDCDGVWVLLAHLQNGSVRVRAGSTVLVGERLGQVGNSGNSAKPHLHVHAQRPGTAAAPASGEPLHILFDDRFLARNSRVRCSALFAKDPG